MILTRKLPRVPTFLEVERRRKPHARLRHRDAAGNPVPLDAAVRSAVGNDPLTVPIDRRVGFGARINDSKHARMSNTRLDLRLTPALRARIELLAAGLNTTMAWAVKTAVRQATRQDGIPSEREVSSFERGCSLRGACRFECCLAAASASRANSDRWRRF
jgi:hypothetical protein